MAGPLSKPDKSRQFAQLQALLAAISKTNLFYSSKLRSAGYLSSLDEFFAEGEAPLRAAEFAELGWTEDTVWAG